MKNSYVKPRQCFKKQRHHFANKCLCSQNYGFSSSHVCMWELDLKKAEHWNIDAFKLWYWRRLLGVPWTARRSNQCILKEIRPEYSLEGLMLKLKLQYFGHLIQRTDSLKRTLMLGKRRATGEGGNRGWDGWIASQTQWKWVWASSVRQQRTEKSSGLQSMRLQRGRHDWELNEFQI